MLEPFFNSLKYWHFDELLRQVGISKPQLSFWLKNYGGQGLIKRIKQKGKMPFYVANVDNAEFLNRKRLFGWKKLADCGLLTHLSSLDGAKVVVLFGSFSRSDWYDRSDVDIFIYGSDRDFEQGKYEVKLNRDIQVHLARRPKDLIRLERMLPYIVSGNFIKGSIEDLGIEVHAKV